jgi:hypothetical protein
LQESWCDYLKNTQIIQCCSVFKWRMVLSFICFLIFGIGRRRRSKKRLIDSILMLLIFITWILLLSLNHHHSLNNLIAPFYFVLLQHTNCLRLRLWLWVEIIAGDLLLVADSRQLYQCQPHNAWKTKAAQRRKLRITFLVVFISRRQDKEPLSLTLGPCDTGWVTWHGGRRTAFFGLWRR